MNRRSLFSKLTLATLATAAEGLHTSQDAYGMHRNAPVKPRLLRRGAVVGVLMPSAGVYDPDSLWRTNQVLQAMGFKVKLATNVGKRMSTKDESIRKRLDDFHQLFTDPSVEAIICIRGGYGAIELIDKIDYDLVRKNPKIFIGFSDATVLLLAINKFSGLVTFHGPTALSILTEYTRNSLWDIISKPDTPGIRQNPETRSPGLGRLTRTINRGSATGTLLGGNLSMITSLLGTPFELDTRNSILFLEDVQEPPYRVGRMLKQLQIAEKLDGLAGVVFGECVECDTSVCRTSDPTQFTLGEEVDHVLAGLKVPAVKGFAIGHSAEQMTLPLGVCATLDADSATLEINENPVIGIS